MKITGKIYARRREQTAFSPKFFKSLQSDGDNEPLMVSADVMRQKTISKVKSLMNNDNLVGHEAEKRTVKFVESTTHFQHNQAHQFSSASVTGKTSHTSIFHSLFRAEMTNIEAGNEPQASIEEKMNADIVPKLVLTRKAAWSGIVGNRDHQALSSILAVGNPNEQNTEDGANLQQSPVTYSESVRNQYRLPRFVFAVYSLSCIILRSGITLLQDPHKRNFKTNQRRNF